MKNYYPGDEYHTSTKRSAGDLLFLGTRWYFYLNIFRVMVLSHKIAKRGLYNDDQWVEMSFLMLKCVENSGGRCYFTGLNNISKHEGPVVFIGNHMSTLETFILPSIIVPRKSITFVIKKDLLDYPIFGTTMRTREPITVGRQNPKEDFRVVMAEGQKILRSGKSLVIFPQSTRMEHFDPEKFNTIGVKLAKRAGVPIVPFALKTDFWGNGKILKDVGPIRRNRDVHFHFEPPMEVCGNGKEEHQKITELVQNKLREWGQR